jgi:hypothetical protein
VADAQELFQSAKKTVLPRTLLRSDRLGLMTPLRHLLEIAANADVWKFGPNVLSQCLLASPQIPERIRGVVSIGTAVQRYRRTVVASHPISNHSNPLCVVLIGDEQDSGVPAWDDDIGQREGDIFKGVRSFSFLKSLCPIVSAAR